jgi:hypothetical protein
LEAALPTFMTLPTFDRLVEVHTQLLDERSTLDPSGAGPSNVFIPWAGNRLGKERGIYYVGIAIDAAETDGKQTFEACLNFSNGICSGHRPHDRSHTPFWRFLDHLTRNILKGPYYETADRWGWSNLLKIGWSNGSPKKWPQALVDRQREVAVVSLREEFSQLRDSLVFIASAEEYGIVRQLVGPEEEWNKDHATKAGIWWLRDKASGNLFINGYHPNAAQRHLFFDTAIQETIGLTDTLLPAFL